MMPAKIIFVLLVLGFTTSLPAAVVWLKGATVIDPEKKTALKTDLKLVDGKINYAKTASRPAKGDTVFELQGKWIIPGIYDMHVHTAFGNQGPAQVNQQINADQIARLVPYAGVTGFLDLFADEDTIFKARAKAKTNPANAAIFASGPLITCTKGHGSELGIVTRITDTPEQAEEQLTQLALKHPDVIKISYDHARGPTMDVPTLTALIQGAKRRGFKTIIHIGTWSDAETAINAGADVITHLYETDIPPELVQLMLKKKTIELPTQTYQADLLYILENRNLLNSPLIQALLPSNLVDAYRHMNPETDPYVRRILANQSRGRYSYPKSLAALVKAGVPLISGTDAGDLGSFHGFSIHREMVWLVDAGASPYQALDSATTAAKKFLKQPSGIREKEKADLVILNSNPLEDITSTQDIFMVFHEGKAIDRAQALAVLKPQ